MSIFVDSSTGILVQGITGKEGLFWTKHMIGMGARVIAGVRPGKGGQTIEFEQNVSVDSTSSSGNSSNKTSSSMNKSFVPVYNTVSQACRKHDDIDSAMLFVPPQFTKDAVLEALDAGIKKIVTIADGIPVHDQVEIRAASLDCSARVVGGNSSGVISPGKSMMGMFPYWIERVYKPGRIGVMTRSGSLTNEVSAMLVREGFGISTLIGVGGDPVPGTRFAEFMLPFQNDSETDALLIVGELGGSMEEEVASMLWGAGGRFTKPLVAFIGGRRAPVGKKMGHAGAIVTGTSGTVASKTAILKEAGALVAEKPSQVGRYLKQALASVRV